MSNTSIPTRILAGTVVPDTPLINKALAYTRAHSDDLTYNHVMRSFLFGCEIASKVDALQTRDLEVHAVAAIMHDLGWDKTGELVSQDKRFEVDGAQAAREFLKKEGGDDWPAQRIQLVWDAIALHTTPSIGLFKEPEVVATSHGITADFQGPKLAYGGHLSEEAYNAIIKEFPRLNFVEGVKEKFCGMCRTKPQVTFDNLVSGFGERYVEGYSLEGTQFIDFIMGHSVTLDA